MRFAFNDLIAVDFMLIRYRYHKFECFLYNKEEIFSKAHAIDDFAITLVMLVYLGSYYYLLKQLINVAFETKFLLKCAASVSAVYKI